MYLPREEQNRDYTRTMEAILTKSLIVIHGVMRDVTFKFISPARDGHGNARRENEKERETEREIEGGGTKRSWLLIIIRTGKHRP